MKRILFSILFILMIIQLMVSPASYAAQESLNLRSSSAILYESNTNTILYSKHMNETKYPASVTKIATAIYALEKADVNSIVTVSENARKAAGTRVYLEIGEQVTLEKLLYGLLINSGNDAATAIAEHISGTEKQFAEDMTNFFNKKLSLTNTNFTNASGLFDENHYTSAYDMAKIVQYGMQNEVFMTMFNTPNMRWIGESWDTTIDAHHRMVNGQIPYEGITGGKNGYVPQSRYTLATTAMQNDMHVIAIVFEGGKNDIYKDTVALLNHGFENFQLQTIEANLTFQTKKTQYQNKKPIHFYVPLESPFTTEIEGGVLHILNEHEETIKTAKLSPIEEPRIYSAVQKNAIDPTIIYHEDTNRGIFTGLIIVVFISILFFSRIK